MLDLSLPVLISATIIGTLGLCMIIYGKNQEDLPAIGGGLLLSIIPFLIASVLYLWLATLGVFAGLWAWRRFVG